MKLNPVYKKELKTSVRTAKMSWTILVYNAILAVIGLLAFYACFANRSRIDYSDILIIYVFIACLEFGLILFVVPALTSSAISGEREKQTLEILLTTTMKPLQIITGKLCASISQIVLLVLSSLPVLSLVFTVGGIRIQDLFMLMLICIVTAVFVGSIGIFYSTVFKRTVPATVMTYGSLIVLMLVTIVGLYVAQLLLIHFYDQQYYAVNATTGLSYNPPKIGYTMLILLWNPAVTIFSMLTEQFGGNNVLRELLSEFGMNNDVIINYWFHISVIVQMVTSAGLMVLSANRLNPLSSGKKVLMETEDRKEKKEKKKRGKRKKKKGEVEK